MQDTANRELDEATPPPFVNGDASHRAVRSQRPAAKSAPRRAAPTVASLAPAEAGSPQLPVADGLAAVLRLQDDWRDRIALLAREQLAFLAEAGGELLAAGEALSAEPDLARRLELAWAHGLRQLERSLDASVRMAEVMAGIGQPAETSAKRRPPG